jgi:hypothetical protein
MSSTPLAIVATFPSLEEAHMAKNLLHANGIAALVDDHGHPAEHLGLASVRLLVEPELAPQVRSLLPNKTRLVNYPPEFARNGEAHTVADQGLESGHDDPPGPSLGAIIVLLIFALALAVAWILLTIFVL